MSKHEYLLEKNLKEDNIIYLFHHIHHSLNEHEVHHCGGLHSGKDYIIQHCHHGLHRINQKSAIGDTINSKLELQEVKIKFFERCTEGGWHLESGCVDKQLRKKNK